MTGEATKHGTIDIGGVTVGRVWLAPMAGYTDIAFRTLALECGAGLTITEMTSTRGFVHGGEGTRLIARDHARP